MKCPKCGFISFDYLDQCKKCNYDLAEYKEKHGIQSSRLVVAPSGGGRPSTTFRQQKGKTGLLSSLFNRKDAESPVRTQAPPPPTPTPTPPPSAPVRPDLETWKNARPDSSGEDIVDQWLQSMGRNSPLSDVGGDPGVPLEVSEEEENALAALREIAELDGDPNPLEADYFEEPDDEEPPVEVFVEEPVDEKTPVEEFIEENADEEIEFEFEIDESPVGDFDEPSADNEPEIKLESDELPMGDIVEEPPARDLIDELADKEIDFVVEEPSVGDSSEEPDDEEPEPEFEMEEPPVGAFVKETADDETEDEFELEEPDEEEDEAEFELEEPDEEEDEAEFELEEPDEDEADFESEDPLEDELVEEELIEEEPEPEFEIADEEHIDEEPEPDEEEDEVEFESDEPFKEETAEEEPVDEEADDGEFEIEEPPEPSVDFQEEPEAELESEEPGPAFEIQEQQAAEPTEESDKETPEDNRQKDSAPDWLMESSSDWTDDMMQEINAPESDESSIEEPTEPTAEAKPPIVDFYNPEADTSERLDLIHGQDKIRQISAEADEAAAEEEDEFEEGSIQYVEEVVEKAGIVTRIVALIIDMSILTLLLAIFLGVGTLITGGFTIPENGPSLNEYARVLALPTYILMLLFCTGYFVVLHGSSGRTLGKKVVGARVVDTEGRRLGYPRSFLRFVGWLFSGSVFFLGFIWAAFDYNRQGWHDKLAHSCVIKDKADPKDRVD